MWLWIIQATLHRLRTGDAAVTDTDIGTAGSVLFAVFARYGDSVIAFKAIQRFIERYPGKKYLLITTHQTRPYAEALIRSPVELISLNKRRDPLRLWQLVRRLQRDPPDLGFNPWSHGEESEYLLSLCRQSAPYRAFASFERDRNLYERAYDYLRLTPPAPRPPRPLPARARRVVVCPFSTDVRKSLDRNDLEQVLREVRARFADAQIVIAGMRQELVGISDGTTRFVLDKSRDASERFIALLRDTDLFVGVDAGPLHLADALSLPAIGVFGPTAPETILDRDSGVRPLRHASMQGVFCDIRHCADPVCVHRLCADLSLDALTAVDFTRRLNLETSHCAMGEPR